MRVCFFGRPHITTDDAAGEEISLQGLPLAMLAALAVAPKRGLTRERLVTLLWPDVEGSRAGHRLTQLRYALKKTLLADPIVGTSGLRIDPTILESDVLRFVDALAQENFQEAVQLAEEPFLDGFTLREAPEFEQWVESVRWEFAGKVNAALEHLVTKAEEGDDLSGAARWLEKIVRRDPADEAAAVRAITAYEAAGEMPAARRLGDWLQRTLRDEYDAEPGDALNDAIERARTGGRQSPAQRTNIPAIAVLPLRNVSPEPENEFFSDGMTDEISGALARIPGLRVASRTSSYMFKGKDVDVRHIAERLGVNLVVEGSLRKVGNKMRLVAQLVSAADGCELWSGTFDRTVADVFELQSELASAIVGALPLGSPGASPVGANGPAPTDPETYTLYLKGRYWANKRTVDALQLATEYFDQAVERDPHFAPGWTGIAECQMMLGFPEYCDMPPWQTMPRAKEAANQALELAPALPEAHLLSGVLCLLYDWDWAAAKRALGEALRLRPIYPLAECWYSMLQSALGHHDEAVARVKRASELDPFALLIRLSVGRALYFARRFDEALSCIRASAEMEPRHPLPRIWLARALLALERYDDALQVVEGPAGVKALESYFECLRAAALVRLGRNDVVLNNPSSPWAFMIGARGRIEEGLATIERCCDERVGHLPWLAVEPLCDPMRSHPRFAKLVERMNLTDVKGAAASRSRAEAPRELGIAFGRG